MPEIDVLISEVGPRDGLQSVKAFMPTPAKKRWIDRLAAAGLSEIEVTSFVPASVVPQLTDAPEIARHATKLAMPVFGRLIASREALQAGLPGESLYGMVPEAGLPRGSEKLHV